MLCRQFQRPRGLRQPGKGSKILHILPVSGQFAHDISQFPRHILHQTEHSRRKTDKHTDTDRSRAQGHKQRPHNHGGNQHRYQTATFHLHDSQAFRFEMDSIGGFVPFIPPPVQFFCVRKKGPFLHIFPSR